LIFIISKSLNYNFKNSKKFFLKKLYAHLNDLEPNTEYAIRVAAFNMKGDGELSQLTKQSRILTGGKR